MLTLVRSFVQSGKFIVSISLTWDSPSSVSADWLIVAVADTPLPSNNIQRIDDSLSGVIAATIARKDFEAKPQQQLTIFQGAGVHATNVLLVGVGKPEDCGLRCLRRSLLAALRSSCQTAEQSVAVVIDDAILQSLTSVVAVELAADCVATAPQGGDLYKTERGRHPFASAVLCVDADSLELNTAITRGVFIGEACNLVRELVNRHPDDLYPETFAADAAVLANTAGLEVVTLDETQLKAERMGAMLGVAKGSARAPRLVKLTYRGGDAQQPMLALVGKGVTFDSGGYSIKPTDGMISMKADMAGAATALGAIIAAAKLKLPVNLTAYLGLVENMISGNAYRLGDVLTARNGTTIEVHNTDAEGRLVLADVLAYAVDDGVDCIVDLATLTGACVVALGEELTGVFPNNQELADELCAGATAAGEFFWQMPMHDHFAPLLKSHFADCKNVGPRWGGAITAAKFLEKFVGKTPWVHLDIAGPSWADSATAWQDVGGTADPVRSLIQWLRSR
jgi:leucyl aminopeptidase